MLSKKFLVTGIVKSKKDGSLYASGLIYNDKNKSWSQRGSHSSYSNYLIPCTLNEKEQFEENMVAGVVVDVYASDFTASGAPIWSFAE